MTPNSVAKVAVGAGLALAGGVALDRRLGLRRRLAAQEQDPDRLGTLRGDVFEVKAGDGVVLHAEVDELAPYGSEADHSDRATVVLVHGFALTLDCWHFQRQAFRGKRRMVLYDQRSHGRSGRSPEENATIDQLGHDLYDVIETLAPGEPLVLVGHSMGGMSIVALAEQHPELFGERVVGLGLISTTAGGQRTHKIVSRYIPDAIGRRAIERGLLVAAERERLLELARRSGSRIALRVIEEFAFGDQKVPPSYVAFLDRMISSTPLKVLVEFIPQFDALDKFHVVESFSAVPTLIMCGTKDKLTSIGHARKLHSRIADSKLVELQGGGHMPIFEFKERVNEHLDELFAEADLRIAGLR
jgi:pimeloyl-ACP methyl ester carboxylesterase